MACIYLLAGLFLLLKGWYILSPVQNIAVGILFVIYAVFRGFRAYHTSGLQTLDENGSQVDK